MKDILEKIVHKLRITFIPCEENSYRPRFLDTQFLFSFVVLLIFLKLVSIIFLFYIPKTDFFAEISKNSLIQLVNNERKANGKGILKENAALNEAARLKGEDMLKNQYFSHISNTGFSPWYFFKQAGYNYKDAGENLAIGFVDSEEVQNAFLESPSHRANILSPYYNEVGIAILRGNFDGKETNIVVQMFGTESKASSSVKEKPVSASTISGTKAETKNTVKSPEAKVLSFMTEKYEDLTGKIIFYSLIAVIIALLLNIFIRIDIQHKGLILKTAAMIAILVVLFYLDKFTVLKFIPHDFAI